MCGRAKSGVVKVASFSSPGHESYLIGLHHKPSMPQVSENLARYLLPNVHASRNVSFDNCGGLDVCGDVDDGVPTRLMNLNSTESVEQNTEVLPLTSPRSSLHRQRHDHWRALCTSAGASRQWLCELDSQWLATSEEPPDVGLSHLTHDELDASQDPNAQDEDATDEGFG